ncbi:DUF2490 domain-containing protein [Candidatus Omnitrophota bacterium]
MQKLHKVLLIILVIKVVFIGKCFAFDDGDFQHWNAESFSWKIDEEWKMKLEEEFRWGDDATNPYYQHSDLGVTFSGIAEWLDLGVNYRHIYEEKSGGWKVENRPHLNATIKWKVADFSFSNRGRFAYRNREDAENFWQYRNKVTVKFPFKLTKLKIQPYIADEIFYDFDVDMLNRNRLYSGFSFILFEHVGAELYYLWQTKESSDKWKDTYVLGTKIKVSF